MKNSVLSWEFAVAWGILISMLLPVVDVAHAADRDRKIDEIDILAATALDINAPQFVDTLLSPPEGTLMLVKLTEKSMRLVGDAPPRGDGEAEQILTGKARIISTLQGTAAGTELEYEFRAHKFGLFDHHDMTDYFLLGTGYALLHLSTPAPGPAKVVDTKFLFPQEWAGALTEFWKLKRDPQAIPFAPIDKEKLAEWEAAADSANPVVGFIALSKLCKSRLVSPAKLVEAHVTQARGIRQTAFLMTILREAKKEDIQDLTTSISQIFKDARSAEQIRGMATCLGLSNVQFAAPWIADGNVESLPVAERIAGKLLKELYGRLDKIEGGLTDEQLGRALRRAGWEMPNLDPERREIVWPHFPF